MTCDAPPVPRTRAAVVGRIRPIPFEGGGSVWSSDMRGGRPRYEETDPYQSKLPAEVLAKSFLDLTREDALLYAMAADKPDRNLDKLIWYKFFVDDAISRGVQTPIGFPSFSHSLDAARTLYLEVPERIPSDPLDVVVEALRQRLQRESVS